MICRLCFLELQNFVDIFNTLSSEELDSVDGIAQIINKYFEIELKLSDPVSTKICKCCWMHLRDFHQFYLMIREKQQALELKSEEHNRQTEWLDTAEVFWQATPVKLLTLEDAAVRNSETTNKLDDVKDVTLAEPIIDVKLSCYNDYNSDKGDSDDNDNDDADSDSVERIGIEHNVLHIKSDKDMENNAAATIKNARARNAKQTAKDKNNDKSQSKTTTPTPPPSGTRKLRVRLHAINVQSMLQASSQITEEAHSTRKRGRPRKTVEDDEESLAKNLQAKRGRPRLHPERPAPSEETRGDFYKRKAISTELDKFIAANVKLDCAICKIPLNDFNELKKHFRMAHKCVGYAMCCNNRFRKRSLLVDHLRLHQDPDYFTCKPCQKKFVSRNCMRVHDLRYHSEQLEQHQCNLCTKQYSKEFLLKQHMRVHLADRERTEKCEDCSKVFRTSYDLRAHRRRMHDASNPPIVCDLCGSIFRTKQNFNVHKRTVHHVGPQLPEAQCTVCGRWLRDENSLRKHMYLHREPERPGAYKCEECGALKPSAAKLNFHKRYHHSKLYQCNLCTKEFRLSVALTEHMATHTGIDLYTCPFCTRTFKSHANMQKHKKKMHPEHWVRKYTAPSSFIAEKIAAARAALNSNTTTLELITPPETLLPHTLTT